MKTLLSLAWRDLRGGGRTLWVFCICLTLGVTLIAASGGLFRQVSDSLQDNTRQLFGGDLEVESNDPLPDAVIQWMQQQGTVSRRVEFRTMMITGAGDAHLVELQSFDANYPLYGEVILAPAMELPTALDQHQNRWGIAIDRVLAQRLQLNAGDAVTLGDADMQVSAVIERQPDRSLRADWRGLPVIISDAALAATGLVQPHARIEYEYRVKTDLAPEAWREAFMDAFPDSTWEIRTFKERNQRLSKVLNQIGSGLLLIGFSALFIGGLGVFNSVQAYLQGKLATIATLRAIGLRDARLATVYLLQILILAGFSSLVGVLLGGALAVVAMGIITERMALITTDLSLIVPLIVAWCFGVLTALTFTIPALGRALSVNPAVLFRGLSAGDTHTPIRAWWATGLFGVSALALVTLMIPDPLFAIGFIGAMLLVLLLLEGLVRLLRRIAHRFADHSFFSGRFVLHLALSNLQRPSSPLRPTLLSLGTSLTLVVASTLVVHTLLRTIDETVPKQSPALVFYDINTAQKDGFVELMEQYPSLRRLDVAPLVLGRLASVNGNSLQESDNPEYRQEARDEHKMSYLYNNFDQVVVEKGALWPDDYQGPPLVAMEDREANQSGLQIGDELTFRILDRTITAELAAIYGQKRFQSRFWLEVIMTDHALDPYITRYVGMAYLDPGQAVKAQNELAARYPNIVTVRTDAILATARELLGQAASGLSTIAVVTLVASLLVLISVVAATRARQLYMATLLHTLGTRISVIGRSLYLEYLVLALLTTVFATVFGSLLAVLLLHYRIELDTDYAWWSGAAAALVISVTSLGLGARYLMRQLQLSPAELLRSGG